jgi:hypothetical protein
MIETITAAADLVNAIPSFWEQIKIPLGVVLVAAGVGSAIMSIHRGVGTAAGKMLGGIALSAIAFGGLGLSESIKGTIDHHSGGVLVGHYGG